MSKIFSPLSDDFYSIPKAELLFQPRGSTKFLNLGDADSVEITISVEETDRYANNQPTRTLVKRVVSQVDAEVSMTLAQMSPYARAASLMSTASVMTQAAATDQTLVIPSADVEAGGIYRLPRLSVSGVELTSATGTGAWVLGTHYKVDGPAGLVEIVAIPAGQSGDLTISYDAAAITQGHQSGIADGTGIRGRLIVRGINAVGVKSMVELHDVELRPASARALISESDFGTVELTGRAYPDGTQPSGFQIGRESTL